MGKDIINVTEQEMLERIKTRVNVPLPSINTTEEIKGRLEERIKKDKEAFRRALELQIEHLLDWFDIIEEEENTDEI